jgi:hypothetical protein
METVMHARFVMIAAVSLAAGTAAPAAEPTKPSAQQAAEPANRPAPQVLLASADQVRAPTPSDQANSPAKPHRAARVTTCRCGGQTEEQPEQ